MGSMAAAVQPNSLGTLRIFCTKPSEQVAALPSIRSDLVRQRVETYTTSEICSSTGLSSHWISDVLEVARRPQKWNTASHLKYIASIFYLSQKVSSSKDLVSWEDYKLNFINFYLYWPWCSALLWRQLCSGLELKPIAQVTHVCRRVCFLSEYHVVLGSSTAASKRPQKWNTALHLKYIVSIPYLSQTDALCKDSLI